MNGVIKFLFVAFWAPVFAWYITTGSEGSLVGLVTATLAMGIIFVEDGSKF